MTLENKKLSSFIFLLIFLTLTISILSSPLQLDNYVNAESDSNSNDDGDDGSSDKDEGDDDDDGDDGSSDKDEGNQDDTGDEDDSKSSDQNTGNTKSSEIDTTQSSEIDTTQSSEIEGTSYSTSTLSPPELPSSNTESDSVQIYQELSNVNSLLDNCDPADPACPESPCDPADPACPESPCDPADPACHTETDCTDGEDNDGDDAIDGEDSDCSAGGPLPPNEREKFCSDGIDNDGNGKVDDINECESDCTDGTDNDADGKIDLEDNDCQIGGPCPLCSPTGGGAGSNNDDRRDNGDVVRGVSSDNGNANDGTSNGDNGNANDGTSNGDTIQSLLSQAQAQAVQGENGEKVYYVLIENANNQTNFVPDKVTLTDEFTVIWINKDSSKDHSLTITNSSGHSLFNSVVQPNNFVKYEFQLEGTYLYSDPDNPQYSGIITILKSGMASENEISKPVQGMDLILSSLGIN
ncbi:MAG: hypothetical protein ACR2KF_02160 [Nitrososphaeraceae archaeon]